MLDYTARLDQKEKQEIIEYHAFTDERDEYRETYELAMEDIEYWRDEGYGNFRIYEQIRDSEGLLIKEDCIFSEGEFPW